MEKVEIKRICVAHSSCCIQQTIKVSALIKNIYISYACRYFHLFVGYGARALLMSYLALVFSILFMLNANILIDFKQMYNSSDYRFTFQLCAKWLHHYYYAFTSASELFFASFSSSSSNLLRVRERERVAEVVHVHRTYIVRCGYCC